MDERVKYKVRCAGTRIWIDLWFDEVQLGSRLVVEGDETIAKMVAAGELRINANSQLVYSDGELYNWKKPITQRRGPPTTASGYEPVARPLQKPFLKR